MREATLQITEVFGIENGVTKVTTETVYESKAAALRAIADMVKADPTRFYTGNTKRYLNSLRAHNYEYIICKKGHGAVEVKIVH